LSASQVSTWQVSASVVSADAACKDTLSADELRIVLLRHRRRVVRRIPKGSRLNAAEKLSDILENIVADPSCLRNWINVLLFGFVCLAVPGQRGGRRHSSKLAGKRNSIISDYPANIEDVSHLQPPQQHRRNGHSSLAERVSAKLEDGDVRGAIRLASSEDTFAQHANNTYEQLRLLHPQRHHCDYAPPSPSASVNNILQLCEADIIAGIKSFHAGSANGLDGLRPQHLKDLIGGRTGAAVDRLVSRLTEFANICLLGRIPASVQSVFCGASLCALSKKSGGICPIAVGFVLRRLIAKCACRSVNRKMVSHFSHTQLGFGTPRAAEAVAHAARCYISRLRDGQAMLKLDFTNAFNSLYRDLILQTVLDELPELYPFIYMCYANASVLQFGDEVFASCEGAQQGDPLGPLLFCLASFKLARSISSEFNVWYLDDGTVAGDADTLLREFELVKREGPRLGLILNERKCEIITDDLDVMARFRQIAPNIMHVLRDDAVLLGAPVGGNAAIESVLQENCQNSSV
jgi:hypothetical protein